MISACIIAKNEEKVIANCLNSIVDYVDEIILVDTGSSDNTIEIAKRYDCKIYVYKWEDDFSKARNYSIAQAKGDFILYIDADEVLQNGDELLSITQNSNNNIGGFLVNVISYNQADQSVLSKQLRLFRNNPQFRFTGRIHEQIGDSIVQAKYQIQNTNININHLGYKIDKKSLKQKYRRNLKLINLELKDNDSHYYQIHKARTLAALQEYVDAIYILRDLLNSFVSLSEQCEVLNLIAEIYLTLKQYDSAIEFFDKSLRIDNTQINVISQLANIYYFLNQKPKSLHYLDILERINKNNYDEKAVEPQDIIFKKAKLLLLLKRYTKALKYLEDNYDKFKDEADILALYSNALLQFEKYEQSLDMLLRVRELKGTTKELELLISKTIEMVNLENQSKPFFSLCMIVKNEEKNLDKCLSSVQDIVDEIIIVDTGSSDRTVEIAKKYTDNIHYFKWVNDFSLARNESLKYAKGKWILYLDADEQILAHPNFLKEQLEELDDSFGGVNCILESLTRKSTGTKSLVRAYYPRIFRNYGYPKIKFEGKVHEQITHSLEKLGKSIAHSNVIINHFGYDTPREIIIKKANRNLKLLLSSLEEKPNDGYLLFQLAQTYLAKEDYDIAFEYFHKALLSPNLYLGIRANIYNTLAQFAGIDGDFHTAIDYAKKSLEITQDQEIAWAVLADGLQKVGKLKEAIQAYKSLLDYKKRGQSFLEIGFDSDGIAEEKLKAVIRNLELKLGAK